MDTARVDRFSCYGYARPTTPRIDALASRGVRFTDCASTSSWTLPAHASMFTGLYPIVHQATQETLRLDDTTATIAEILGSHGYATIGVSANPLVGPKMGLDRGFAEFHETWRASRQDGAQASGVHPNLAAVAQFLDKTAAAQPFFLFVNYIEPHAPYEPPEPFRARFLAPGTAPGLAASSTTSPAVYYLNKTVFSPAAFRAMNELYDGEIAYVDEQVGKLIDLLDAHHRLDNTLVLITSDHGENIGDHDHYRHVFSLYNTTVKVPLIALLPGGVRAGEVRTEPVQLVDLFATMLAACGIAPPNALTEQRDILAAEARAPRPALFAEYYYPVQALGLFTPQALRDHEDALRPFMRRLRAVEAEGMRLICGSDGQRELYDVVADPGETRNLLASGSDHPATARLTALLDEFVRRGAEIRPLPPPPDHTEAAPPITDDDQELLRRLRSLGYIR
jgi:arylsulfatase A-like enzyme